MRALLLIPVLLLAGCAAPAPTPDDGVIHIVASTNVYGDIAAAIGGDQVEVVSIVDDPAQDPHSVEASARVQLELSRADLVIENGAGYDEWLDVLLRGLDNPPTTLAAWAVSPHAGETDVNEHVWYDFDTVQAVATELRTVLTGMGVTVPDSDFSDRLVELQKRKAEIADLAAGRGVAVTEPLPLYLLTGCGLVNVTPSAFSEAIEEGTDVPPTALRDTLALFDSGAAALLVYNEQTTSPETERGKAAAIAAGVPVVSVWETLPPGLHYLDWMSQNLDAIEAALN
jgi:zinc/manganese transport system substrate-binding protein